MFCKGIQGNLEAESSSLSEVTSKGLFTRHPFIFSIICIVLQKTKFMLTLVSNEGLSGVLGNKGTLAKYRREQGNISQFLGTGEQNSKTYSTKTF